MNTEPCGLAACRFALVPEEEWRNLCCEIAPRGVTERAWRMARQAFAANLHQSGLGVDAVAWTMSVTEAYVRHAHFVHYEREKRETPA